MHTSILKIPLLVLALLMGSLSLHAQQDDNWFEEEDAQTAEKGKISGGIIHLPFGYTSNSKAGLNDALQTNGIAPLQSEEYTWGADGTFVVRNFVIRIGATNTFRQSSPGTSVEIVDYNQKFREIGLGYNAFSKKGLIIYPTAHFGRFKSTAISAVQTASPQAPAVLGGAYIGTEARQIGYYAGAGIGLDYMFGFDEVSGAGLALGLQAGYNYQLSASNWEAYGRDLGPDLGDDISGFYLRLSIGFAGWHRQ